MKIPSSGIRGREISVISFSVPIHHLSLGERRDAEFRRTRAYGELEPVFRWLSEYCGSYGRRWVVVTWPIERMHPQQPEAEDIHTLILSLTSDDDVFAFKMRWC